MIDARLSRQIPLDDKANAASLYRVEALVRPGVGPVDYSNAMINLDFDSDVDSSGWKSCPANSVLRKLSL